MTEYRPRLFASDAAVERVGEGLLTRTLPRLEWTHEAHLAATTYLLLRHPEIDLDEELPGLIRRYNESVGGCTATRKAIMRRSPAYSFAGFGFSWKRRTRRSRSTSWSMSCCSLRWAAAIGHSASIREKGFCRSKPAVNSSNRTSLPCRDQAAFVRAIYSSMFLASTSIGTLPPSTTASSNALRSYFGPSSAFARSRKRLIVE